MNFTNNVYDTDDVWEIPDVDSQPVRISPAANLFVSVPPSFDSGEWGEWRATLSLDLSQLRDLMVVGGTVAVEARPDEMEESEELIEFLQAFATRKEQEVDGA